MPDAEILAQAPKNKKPTVGFSARFFSLVSSTVSWGYVEILEERLAKPLFCLGKGQNLHFDAFFGGKSGRGETIHARKPCSVFS
jgi:hypothetical protein